MNEEIEKDSLSELEKLSAIEVFEKIGRQLSKEKSRSLWKRLHSEMESGGMRSAISWLESDLEQKSEQVHKALSQFKEVEE